MTTRTMLAGILAAILLLAGCGSGGSGGSSGKTDPSEVACSLDYARRKLRAGAGRVALPLEEFINSAGADQGLQIPHRAREPRDCLPRFLAPFGPFSQPFGGVDLLADADEGSFQHPEKPLERC